MSDDSPPVGAAKAGGAAELASLLEVYRGYLWSVAHAELDPRLYRKVSPSDLVQDTFIEAQRDFPLADVPNEAKLRGWLRALLLNNLADARRRFRGTAKRAIQRERALYSREARELLERLVTDPSISSRNLSEQEQVKRLSQALQTLRAEYRQIILWRNREQLTWQTIGDRVGRTPDAVRMLWRRAIAQLKRELKGDDHDSSHTTR